MVGIAASWQLWLPAQDLSHQCPVMGCGEAPGAPPEGFEEVYG